MAQAPGFQAEFAELNVQRTGTPQPPLTFTLEGSRSGHRRASEGSRPRICRAARRRRHACSNRQKWDEAIGVYRAILRSAPPLERHQPADRRRVSEQKDYDNGDRRLQRPAEGRARQREGHVGIGADATSNKGDLQGGRRTLTQAAAGAAAGREVFYALGEVKLRRRTRPTRRSRLYQKAAAADPSWGKPLYQLGTVALNKGDNAGRAQGRWSR